MANNVVTLEVVSRLGKISEELARIASMAKNSGESIQEFTKKTGESQQKQIQHTNGYLGRLRQLSRNVRDAMVDDFKAMASMVGVSEGLKLGSQFRKAITETIELAGTIRKLGHVFGIEKDNFAQFQETITKGLGEIGLSAVATQNALVGLSETQVRGEQPLTEYAKTAGELAGVGRERGREGDVAKGLADVMREQGKPLEDVSAMRIVGEAVRKAVSQTGRGPTEVLRSLQSLLSKMPQDLRKAISPTGLTNLATLEATAGPAAAQFLEHYLTLAPTERMPMEAMGFKNLFTEQGLDVEKFKTGADKLFSAHPKDPRLMAQLLGVSDEAAEGFVRLYENLNRVKTAQERVINDQRKLRDVYWESMTAGEAFEASLNRVRATLSKPVSIVIQAATEKLQEAAKTNTGAAAVTAGSVVLASLLFGRGLQGLLSLGRGKVTGVAERVAYEQLTGKEVNDVYVVNAQEIGQSVSGGIGGVAPVAGGGGLAATAALLGKSIVVAAAAFAGYKTGEQINEMIAGTAADEMINKVVDSIADFTRPLWDQEGILDDVANAPPPPEKEVKTTFVSPTIKDLKLTKEPSKKEQVKKEPAQQKLPSLIDAQATEQKPPSIAQTEKAAERTPPSIAQTEKAAERTPPSIAQTEKAVVVIHEVRPEQATNKNRTTENPKPSVSSSTNSRQRIEVAVEVTKKPDDLRTRAYERLNRGANQ